MKGTKDICFVKTHEPGTKLNTSCIMFHLLFTNPYTVMDLIPILKIRKLRLGEHILFIPTLPPSVRADLQSLLKIMKIRIHRFQC